MIFYENADYFRKKHLVQVPINAVSFAMSEADKWPTTEEFEKEIN